MVQVTRGLPRTGIAEALGEGLGQGAGGVLQALAQDKLNQMASQRQLQQQQESYKTAGLNPAWASLPVPLQTEMQKHERAKELGRFVTGENTPPMSSLGQALQGEQNTSSGQRVPLTGIDQIRADEARKIANLSPLAGENSQMYDQAVGRIQKEAEQKAGDYWKQQSLGVRQAEIKKTGIEKATNAILDIPKRIANYDKIIAVGTRSPDQLRSPAFRTFLKNAGLETFDVYGRPLAEDVLRSSIAQLGVARVAMFKGLGNMSDRDLEAAMKAEPSLYQTNEGMVAVAKQNKALDQADLAYNNAYNNILDVNNGIPPMNIEQQAHRMSQPARDKAAEEVRNSYRALGVVFDGDIQPGKVLPGASAHATPVGTKILVKGKPAIWLGNGQYREIKE